MTKAAITKKYSYLIIDKTKKVTKTILIYLVTKQLKTKTLINDEILYQFK